ncbi:MAG TPA: LCP family protein [Acidimicrobiales bacterium]|nr:LCP family protein [Acidimicrobiales bacterium]
MTDFPPGPRNPYRRPDRSWGDEPAPSGRRGSPDRSRRPARGARGANGAKGALIGRRRWPRRALVAINVIVAVCLIGAVSAYGYVQWRLGQIHRENLSSLSASGGGKPFTLLIVGSDSRAALSQGAGNAQFGSASQTPGQRSDTIIVARVAPASRQIEMMSIPRDLWVNIPGMGQNRINSAFDSGPNLLIKTIETDLGIPVNHFVEVNFDSFRAITDAVGGVKFYFPTPARDPYSLLNVPKAGCVLLTGDQALGFVRSRHYQYYENGYWHVQGESDLARVQRQQAFIKKLLKKAEGEYTNPVALNSVIAGITKNLTVDSGFSNSLILALAKDFRSMNASSIPSLTLPNYPFTTSGGAQVLGLQQPQAAQTIDAFNHFGDAPPPHSSTTKPSSQSSTSKAPAVTVAPSSVSVEVANGTGVNGQAGQLTDFLTKAGYHATTNTANLGTGASTTEIRYAPDALTAAKQLAAAIPGGGRLVESSALTPTAYSVEVVTGASYTSAARTAGSAGSGSQASSSSTSASSAASPATTTPSTVPGTDPTRYTLPGSPAGQAPPSCT